MKKILSRIFIALGLLTFVAMVAVFLHFSYQRERVKADITQISVELQEIQKKYAEEKIDEARQQMKTVRELLTMQQNMVVRASVLPSCAQVYHLLGFSAEAASALQESVELSRMLNGSEAERAAQFCFLANTAYIIGDAAQAEQLLAEAEGRLPHISANTEKALLCFRIADSAALQRDLAKMDVYRAKVESFLKLSKDPKWKTDMASRLGILDEMRQDLQVEAEAQEAEKKMSAQEKLDREP